MTDRIKAFTVVLDADYRVDDVESIRLALSMVHGVAGVVPVVASVDDYVNRVRIRLELLGKLQSLLVPEGA